MRTSAHLYGGCLAVAALLCAAFTPGHAQQVSQPVQSEQPSSAALGMAGSRAAQKPSPQAAQVMGLDTRITVNASPQNETSIAGDPNDASVVIGGFNDYSLLVSGFGGNGVAFTTNGGSTWTHSGTGVPLPASFTTYGGDPGIGFNSQGRAYYSHIAGGAGATIFRKNNGVFVASSTNGGSSWGATVAVASHVYTAPTKVDFEDKLFVNADHHSASPYKDRVYLSWTRFYSGNYPGTGVRGGGDILFSSSTDNGANWTAPARISDPLHEASNGGTGDSTGLSFVQGSEPEAEADGDVYVAYWFGGRTNVQRSTDGGATFGSPTYPFGAAFNVSDIRSSNPFTFRVNSYPNIETDPSRPDFVYVVAADSGPGGAGRDQGDIIFARSTDDGATWGPTLILNDDLTGRLQVFPWMAVDHCGNITVIWYDNRLETGPPILDVFETHSTDGGVTWSPNARVTDVSFNPNTGQFGGNSFFGDYNGIGVSPNGKFHALWTDARTAEQEIFTDSQYLVGEISGMKWSDLDSDGVKDLNEPGIPGVTIILTGITGTNAQTDSTGRYSFTCVYPGNYSVSESTPPNSAQTYPPGGVYIISLSAGQVIDTLDFGNHLQTGRIQGTKWEDTDGDGVFDLLEQGLEGWKIVAVSSVPETLSAVTDSSGNYSFEDLVPGEYRVEEVQQDGWVQTGGESAYTLTVAANETADSTDFGNFRSGTICGQKFNDLDSSGGKDPGESGISSWQICITRTGPPTLESRLSTAAPDTCVSTDSLGNYCITGLPAGVYVVAETQESGWGQTTPDPLPVTITSGSNVTGVDFGNKSTGCRICVHKFDDVNHNQQRDAGEPPMENVAFHLVADTGSGSFDMVTDAGGVACFNVPAGLYRLSETPAPGYTVSFPKGGIAELACAGGTDTTLVWLNAAQLTDSSFRTASMPAWATAVDGKGKLKAVKCKPVAVHFKFNVVAPKQASGLTLKLSMFSTGVMTRGKNKSDTLASWTNLKVITYSAPIDSGDTLQFEGIGIKGKAITGTALWAASPRAIRAKVLSYKINLPLLPMPNLHNVGAELEAQHAFPVVLGAAAGASSVAHAKYKDTQGSLNAKGTMHTGDPACLSKFSSGRPIARQQKKLPPTKSNNRLFAEALALALNVLASDYGKFPPGLGDLVYDNHKDTSDTSSSFFNGKPVRDVLTQAKAFLGCTETPKPGADAGDYLNVVKKINDAFDGPIDTLGWSCGKLRLTGVRLLKDVPYLRALPGVIPPFVAPESPFAAPVPGVFILDQNYPNPFNPSTMIQFDLPDPAFVTLIVYNILGQEVATLIDNEALEDGVGEVEFDGTGLPSGVYIYRLTAASIEDDEEGIPGRKFTSERKMLLLK